MRAQGRTTTYVSLAQMLREVERELGPKRYRKVNLWLSPEDHRHLSALAYAYAEERGATPSLHAFIGMALDMPSHHRRLAAQAAKTTRRPRPSARANVTWHAA